MSASSKVGAHVRRRSNRMSDKSTLHTVPPLPGRSTFEYGFEVAAEALLAGTQDVHVQVLSPLSGPQRGQIGVSRVLIYAANREALASFVDAWTRAAALAENRQAYHAHLTQHLLPELGHLRLLDLRSHH